MAETVKNELDLTTGTETDNTQAKALEIFGKAVDPYATTAMSADQLEASYGFAYLVYRNFAMYEDAAKLAVEYLQRLVQYSGGTKELYCKAANLLGCFYYSGIGISQNYDDGSAVGWFTLAANAGHTGAMHNLSMIYSNEDKAFIYNEELAKYWDKKYKEAFK